MNVGNPAELFGHRQITEIGGEMTPVKIGNAGGGRRIGEQADDEKERNAAEEPTRKKGVITAVIARTTILFLIRKVGRGDLRR